MNRKYMDAELKKATSHLAKLTHKGSFLRGNIVTMKRVCGHPNCKCAVEGKKHVSMYIGKKQDATTKMIYIPRRLEDEIEKKINAYHRIKKLVERISELNYAELKIKKDKKIV
ncbi:unnamed protein product [marine sediment metagenome]|uniref:DUF6788 domain-containing protein n=1 Tax=marine sediment metagenome TaxID=412755 RepID=X0YXC4_9ZZZZ